MKYMTLVLLFALQVNADDFVCNDKNNEIVTIYGLSPFKEDHKATLKFVESVHPNPSIVVNVTTTAVREFFDWEGQGLEMKRVIVADMLPYPTFHFRFEINHKTGGHCNHFDCGLNGVFYHNDQPANFTCTRIIQEL